MLESRLHSPKGTISISTPTLSTPSDFSNFSFAISIDQSNACWLSLLNCRIKAKAANRCAPFLVKSVFCSRTMSFLFVSTCRKASISHVHWVPSWAAEEWTFGRFYKTYTTRLESMLEKNNLIVTIKRRKLNKKGRQQVSKLYLVKKFLIKVFWKLRRNVKQLSICIPINISPYQEKILFVCWPDADFQFLKRSNG